MRLLHHRLAEWLRNDPRATGEDPWLLGRKAEIRPVFNGEGELLEYHLRLIGGSADNQRHTTLAVMREQSGSPSGGGSAPDTIEAAVNSWCRAAGYPDEVKGGAR